MSEVNHSKASGHFEITGWYGELEEGATLSCVHCQATWIIQKGSGKLRGFCQNCMGFICGANCMECVPFEQKIENAEAGLPACHRPIRVFVPPSIDDVS